MAANLFIIEAPGKRKGLAEVLRGLGMRDVEVEATVGHLGTNPAGFKPLCVDAQYCETAYRIKADKEHLAMNIAAKAALAARIYLATDDDQEGDVIARDVLRFCVREEDRHKIVRLRLKALSRDEVAKALREASPFDELMAAQGDARRVIDRLIGSLSGDAGAVGRVQGSLLLAMQRQRPVVGVVTHTMGSLDGQAPFVAREPVFAGDIPPEPVASYRRASVASHVPATMAAAPMNHDQILLSASLRTNACIEDVSRAMQTLYERGRMSYPRAKDCSITPEALRRLSGIARGCGATFRAALVSGVRTLDGAHGHEAPSPLVVDVPVNRHFGLMTLEEQVLVCITQNLLDTGIEARIERPDLSGLPAALASKTWMRVMPMGIRLWEAEPVQPGLREWTQEQSLLHLMAKNGLGRPSTVVSHIDKFLTRGLVTQAFDLTEKGQAWRANVAQSFGDRNISKLIEEYIESHRNVPSTMVKDMVELFKLHAVASTVVQPTELANEDHDRDADEVSAGYVP